MLKHLPQAWLYLILLLMNLVFLCGYPLAWSTAKLTMLFKKGSCSDCNNYREISVINSFAKIYDYILNQRLINWFKPCREQAGAQPKRGCLELILTVRLLISFCMKRKKKLFIVFVDFSKAYDRVPRGKLFFLLKIFGCGAIMLHAIISMYNVTTCLLGSTTINTFIGVRQGSPTSCFLFILYVDMLIRSIKNNVEDDSFLKWLHILMLMDDTVIFASSRERLLRKLEYLNEFCVEYGMIINEKKTKIMVVNGDDTNRLPIHLGDVCIRHCTDYVYLGSIITEDGKLSSSILEHALKQFLYQWTQKNRLCFIKFDFLPIFCLPGLVPNSELTRSRGLGNTREK